MTIPIAEALEARSDDMVAACTRCGKCVEACPVTAPAGVAAAPDAVIAGVIDILRGGTGTDASRRWAAGCAHSGDCITTCDDGVNPRFLLTMARLAMTQAAQTPRERRRAGVATFRQLHADVTAQSRMQLDDDGLARLGQRIAAAGDGTPPEFVFYTGCNLLRTPHIAELALDIMDALGVSYRIMGGPTHCCGINQLRTGDVATSGNVAETTLDKLAAAGRVLTWCASCYVQFTEVMLPARERAAPARRAPEMIPFVLYLGERIDDLRALMRVRVPIRVALHRHPGIPGVVAAATALLAAVPGVELVDLGQPAVGLMSVNLRSLPEYRRRLQLDELKAARAAGVDALVAVYHPDHRELCAHERDWPFRVLNLLDVVAAGLGLGRDDRYKRLKMLQDVDAILSACRDRLAGHGIAEDAARASIAAMLADQPVPLAARPGGA